MAGPPSTQNLSKKKKSTIAAVKSIYRAVDKKKHTLDYKKANKYDKGKTTTRRKFAAGYLWTGGKIKNISKTELKRVKKYLPKKSYSKVRAMGKRGSGDSPARCTGVTKLTTKQKGPWFDNHYYYNSCDTATIIYVMDQVAVLGGLLIGAAKPGAGAALAALVTAGNNTLKRAKDRSDLGAVIVRDTFHLIRVYPQ